MYTRKPCEKIKKLAQGPHCIGIATQKRCMYAYQLVTKLGYYTTNCLVCFQIFCLRQMTSSSYNNNSQVWWKFDKEPTIHSIRLFKILLVYTNTSTTVVTALQLSKTQNLHIFATFETSYDHSIRS